MSACAADVHPPVAACAVRTVAMYEPHPPGHPHHRYSTCLARALHGLAGSRWKVELLLAWTPEGPSRTAYEHPVIDPLRPLSGYRRRAAGALDRCLRWGLRDRQVAGWVLGRDGVAGVHYQASAGLATWPALARLRASGVPALLTVHNVRPHERRAWEPQAVRERIDRAVYGGFDALLVHSAGLRRELEALLGSGGPPVYVVAHGVAAAAAPATPLAVRMARRRLVFVGAPRPNKGLPVLLEAMRHLPGYSLTLAGYHSLDVYRRTVLDPLIAAARGRGVRIDVMEGFLGEAEMEAALAEPSAVVLPYLDFSAQSGVLSQALSLGLPVVASDVGALGETVREYGTGVAVPPGDPAALAAGVRTLEQMPPAGLEAALLSASRACSWERTAAATVRVYEEVFGA